ncbi:MBL fold metallo-hydrolase [Propylenella binzhouense]|uniref:MBL fold metallo-hydrolase n=1 Tax=Propylenella binzhouense TaxID=2555902 RepID=A0A964T2E6_9HYPH|nr:MBL fold metallo-hydrolase [Propylenella binzhouense]MYZ47231.1 MBL fold metallo-hydrolase [Propylenella binzhouense]
MPSVLKVTVLGCGSSPGVPRIGNHWGDCDPDEPRNRRRRCSVLLERIGPEGTTRVLVDTSPDLRDQAIDAEIGWIDAVLYTHAHADHIHGIDDLRGFFINMRRKVDIHADAPTLERLKEGFRYCFETPPGSDYPPILTAHLIDPDREIVVEGRGGPIRAMPVVQVHGRTRSLAFRVGGFAYSPDVNDLDDEAQYRLRDLDVWVVDALRYTSHPSHFSVDEALAWIERLKPKQAYLTHMHIDLDYNVLCGRLPAHVRPSYDGMSFELPLD